MAARDNTSDLANDQPRTPGKRTQVEALEVIQRKIDAWSPAPLDDAEAPVAGPTGSGVPLEAGVRQTMERLFGADFSAVRIHEGEHATAAGAIAYTQGTHIHFAPGQYDPHSERGRKLLGHELAHVVQQAARTLGATGKAGGHALNDDAGLEAEADRLGERVARGESVAPRGDAAAVPARDGGAIQRVKLVKDGCKGWTTWKPDKDKTNDETKDEIKDDEQSGENDVPQSRGLVVDTEELHDDPFQLFEIASSIKDTGLANKVWADYLIAMERYCKAGGEGGVLVVRLDNSNQPRDRGMLMFSNNRYLYRAEETKPTKQTTESKQDDRRKDDTTVTSREKPEGQLSGMEPERNNSSEKPEPPKRQRQPKLPEVKNLRTVRPVYVKERNLSLKELRPGELELNERASALIKLLRASPKLGQDFDRWKLTEQQVAFIKTVSEAHGAEPVTLDRTVFVTDDNWDQALEFYRTYVHAPVIEDTGPTGVELAKQTDVDEVKQSFDVEDMKEIFHVDGMDHSDDGGPKLPRRNDGEIEHGGERTEGTRRATATLHGMTMILREESSSASTIAATFEIQIGEHSIEYKWQRSAQEQRLEQGRVDHWDPESPIARVHAALAASKIAQAATGSTTPRSGGSSGPVERTQFDSLETFVQSGLAGSFKEPALVRLIDHPAPSHAKLLFVNRNFIGSRIEVGNEGKLEDQDGFTTVEPVRSYLQGKVNQDDPQAAPQLLQLMQELDTDGQRGGATGQIPLISIQQRFWARFEALGETDQIAQIDEALAPFGETKRSRIEVSSQLPYGENQDMLNTEPHSTLQIGEYTFDISSRHAYKFHEQSLDSHPGHGGTQKEVELAIAHAALTRHLAGALPRTGAIGGIGESQHAVVVGGVRIVYLAWVSAPAARLIHISDYMAKPVAQPEDRTTTTTSLGNDNVTGGKTSDDTTHTTTTISNDDTLERMLDEARRFKSQTLGAWEEIAARALRALGHVPRALLVVLAEQIQQAPQLALDAFTMLRNVAPPYLPDLIAELTAVAGQHNVVFELGLLAIECYGGPGQVPDIVVATFALRLKQLAPDQALAVLGKLELAARPVVQQLLG